MHRDGAESEEDFGEVKDFEEALRVGIADAEDKPAQQQVQAADNCLPHIVQLAQQHVNRLHVLLKVLAE